MKQLLEACLVTLTSFGLFFLLELCCIVNKEHTDWNNGWAISCVGLSLIFIKVFKYYNE